MVEHGAWNACADRIILGRGNRALGPDSSAQHAELVALGISHHDPRWRALADVDPCGAERFEPADLGVLVAVSRREVEMESITTGLRWPADIVGSDEQHARKVLERPLWPAIAVPVGTVDEDFAEARSHCVPPPLVRPTNRLRAFVYRRDPTPLVRRTSDSGRHSGSPA